MQPRCIPVGVDAPSPQSPLDGPASTPALATNRCTTGSDFPPHPTNELARRAAEATETADFTQPPYGDRAQSVAFSCQACRFVSHFRQITTSLEHLLGSSARWSTVPA